MAIKKVEKNKADETVQKKKKHKVSVDTQVIIIDDDENDTDGCSDLPKKAKVKKKKGFLKRKYLYQEGTKEKKKKKRDSDIKNKACANLPIIIESDSDSEVVMKNRKLSKIRKKKVAQRLPCEGGGICEALRQFSKRKDPGNHGESAECIEKKKKHKATCSLMLHSEDNEVESQKQTISNGEAVSQDAASPGRKKRQTLVKNKAKKRKLLALDNEGCKDGIPDKRNANPAYQLQGENGCKRRALGTKGHQDSVAQVSEEETRVIRKKRKKKKPQNEKASSFATSAKNQENNPGVSNKNLLKAKLRKLQVCQEKKMELIQDTEGAGRVTKKKTIHTALLEEDASVLKEHKKKIKKCKDIHEFTVTVNSGRCENGGKQHIKKRKNMDKGNVDNCEEEPSLKEGKLKKETEEDEIKVVAFKKGNCDEISIDKSRRQALQEEIDWVSGKTKAVTEEEEGESCFGQWSTAAFGSSERKDKFLRLLGGFKRSPSASAAQGPPGHAPKPNMAFDWKKEQSLQRDLQTEFETAVNRKHHRSIGLGFQHAARKHMQIDKYASKSIKFED